MRCTSHQCGHDRGQGPVSISDKTSYCEISQSLEAQGQVQNVRIALKFGRHISSSAAEVPAKFQSDWTILNTNLTASRLCKILQYNVLSDIETGPRTASHLSIGCLIKYISNGDNTELHWAIGMISQILEAMIIVNNSYHFEIWIGHSDSRPHRGCLSYQIWEKFPFALIALPINWSQQIL